MFLAPTPIQWICWVIGWLGNKNGLAILGRLEIRSTLRNGNIDAASRIFLIVQVTTSNALLCHVRIGLPAIIRRVLAGDFTVSRYINSLLVRHGEGFPVARMLVPNAVEGSTRLSMTAGTVQGRMKKTVAAMREVNVVKSKDPDPDLTEWYVTRGAHFLLRVLYRLGGEEREKRGLSLAIVNLGTSAARRKRGPQRGYCARRLQSITRPCTTCTKLLLSTSRLARIYMFQKTTLTKATE